MSEAGAGAVTRTPSARSTSGRPGRGSPRRWWLPVAGLVIGAVLGVLVSVGGGDVYRARDAALPRPAVHARRRRPDPEPRDEPEDGERDHPLARPRSSRPQPHAGCDPASCAATSPRTAVVSAGQAHERLAARRDHGHARRRRAQGRARGELARRTRVIGVVSTYVDQKIELLERADRLEHGRSSRTSTAHRDARSPSSRRSSTTRRSRSTDKLLVIGTSTTRSASREQRRGTVQQDLFQNQQLLSLAENVEKSKIVQPAVGAQDDRRRAAATPPRSARLIGLLLGALVADVADPFLRRRNARSAA